MLQGAEYLGDYIFSYWEAEGIRINPFTVDLWIWVNFKTIF